jgi:hypothetical protein
MGPGAYLGKVPDEEALNVLDNYYTWRRSAEGKEWAK